MFSFAVSAAATLVQLMTHAVIIVCDCALHSTASVSVVFSHVHFACCLNGKCLTLMFHCLVRLNAQKHKNQDNIARKCGEPRKVIVGFVINQNSDKIRHFVLFIARCKSCCGKQSIDWFVVLTSSTSIVCSCSFMMNVSFFSYFVFFTLLICCQVTISV